MAKLTKTAIILAVMAVTAGALAWAFWPKPIVVETALVGRGLFKATVEEDGRTRIRNRYVVSAPLAGRVLRSELKAGDAVTQGAVVATLLPFLPPLLEARTRHELEERVGGAEAAFQEAETRLERATAQEAQEKADAERARALRQKEVASAQQLERAELAFRLAKRDREAAELRRHAAEHELAQAKALLTRYDTPDQLERWSVTAPVEGRVLKIDQESEAPVSAGAPLVEIGDPHDLEIVVDLLTADAVEVRPGADVSIERWGGPEPLAGRVRLVEPAGFTKVSALGVEEQRVWVAIDIVSPRALWAGLGDAFRADVRITVATISDATLAPASALFRRGAGWAAFVAEGGRARERAVTIARRDAREAVVTNGLSAGERVVVFPPTGLTDGAFVALR